MVGVGVGVEVEAEEFLAFGDGKCVGERVIENTSGLIRERGTLGSILEAVDEKDIAAAFAGMNFNPASPAQLRWLVSTKTPEAPQLRRIRSAGV